jgi:hypothetical protein
LIPESQQDSEVEVLHSFGKLTNIDGKVPKRRKNEEESDVDSNNDIIEKEEVGEDVENDEEEDIKEEEEAFPPEFGDLQSVRERCKALASKIIDEQRHQRLVETLNDLRRYKITLSQPNPSTELLERDALKKPQYLNK